jgi:hypothetical protein
MDHFPWRSSYAVFLKFLFCSNLVESDLASGDAIAGISDAAAVKDSLKLPIFAKRSVDGIERQINIARQLKIFIPHIDVDHFCS